MSESHAMFARTPRRASLRVRVAAIALALGASCAPSTTASDSAIPISPSGFHKAPPKPGHSITGTKACSCHACEPRACCTEESAGEKRAECGDSYDFTQNGCGLEVSSCTSRCYRKTWRMRLHEACSARVPDECCGSVDS